MKAAVIQMFHFCPNKNTIRMYFECKRFRCDHFGNNYDAYALHWRSLFRFWKKNININFQKKTECAENFNAVTAKNLNYARPVILEIVNNAIIDFHSRFGS